MPAGPLFVFADESGNFDFSTAGTKHFVLAALITSDPVKSGNALQRIRYEFLSKGVNIPFFHASTDRQFVRDQVISRIASLRHIEVHTIGFEKTVLDPEVQHPAALYVSAGISLGSTVKKAVREGDHTSLVFVFDKALSNAQQNAFLSGIKPYLARISVPFHIVFHNVKYEPNGQIADYFAWARYISLERAEHRPIRALHMLEKSFRMV